LVLTDFKALENPDSESLLALYSGRWDSFLYPTIERIEVSPNNEDLSPNLVNELISTEDVRLRSLGIDMNRNEFEFLLNLILPWTRFRRKDLP